MKELWNQTFELFRSRLVLWVPCSAAAILMLVLDRLEKAWAYWLFEFLLTQRSVLGGSALSADIAGAQHRALMVGFPVGFLKQFLEVWLFVVALFMTKELVRMILIQRPPEMIAALRNIAPRYRGILLFSIKYMVLMGAFALVLGVLVASPFTSARINDIALSKAFVNSYSLVAEACIAWLLVPAAIRLLRPPGSSTSSTQERRIGTIFAVATSAVSLAIQHSIGKAETVFVIDARWQEWSLAAVNTVVINAPMVILFVALALLALQDFREEDPVAAEPELS